MSDPKGNHAVRLDVYAQALDRSPEALVEDTARIAYKLGHLTVAIRHGEYDKAEAMARETMQASANLVAELMVKKNSSTVTVKARGPLTRAQHNAYPGGRY